MHESSFDGRTLQIMLLVAVLFSAGLSGVRAADFKVGRAFPHLAFPSLENGKPTSVDSFRGNKLILHIWASW